MKNLDLKMNKIGIHLLQKKELIEIHGGDIFLEDGSGIFYWYEMWSGPTAIERILNSSDDKSMLV